MNSKGMPEVDRSDQWLGVIVDSAGTPDGKALVCEVQNIYILSQDRRYQVYAHVLACISRDRLQLLRHAF